MQVQGQEADEAFVRLTTEDTELLLPALVQVGASFRLTPHVVELHGVDEAEIAALAALHNARVVDLELVRPVRDTRDVLSREAAQATEGVATEPAA